MFFDQLLALIYLIHIDRKMHENSLYCHYTMQGLLDELDLVEYFEHPSHQPHVGEMTKKQAELSQLLCTICKARSLLGKKLSTTSHYFIGVPI